MLGPEKVLTPPQGLKGHAQDHMWHGEVGSEGPVPGTESRPAALLLRTPDSTCLCVQDRRVLGPLKQQGFMGPLVFIGNATTALRLGCNNPSTGGCFFNFTQVCIWEKRSSWP